MPRRAYVRLKRIRPSQQPSKLKHKQSDSVERYSVRIYKRNLAFVSSNFRAVGRLGHWSIQAGDVFFELLLPHQSTELGITYAPAHPFEGYKYETIPKETTTTMSPEEVRQIVQSIYDSEFSGHYHAGIQDCQNFCMRIWEDICDAKDEKETLRQYFKSYSGALAYSTMSPPTHLTHPRHQGSHVSAASHHRHGGHHGGMLHNIASQPWFISAVASS